MKKLTLFVFASAFVAGAFLSNDAGAQTCRAAQPSICNRSCWSARAPKCAISQLSGLSRAIIHHTANASDFNTTGSADTQAKVRAIQNYHMDSNGWCDIGYHFLADKNGYLLEGRAGSIPNLPRGAHDGCNDNSFGFNWMGYFHSPYNQTPTSNQRGALYAAIAWKMPSGWSPYGASTYCGVSVGKLDGHRRVKATACPGDIAYGYITTNTSAGEARTNVAGRRGC